ncbi:hypothetical protein OA93_14580 [Flavobacterium sp. KMS]|uniref:erythromycin esterase family protein n=1 Tax=Flavobacterium sp. KMS TaxID=1566023 RepID=UPI00057D0E59|nr:erythromycin esterase family protein [Flavobacterium sp. KMS]KIA97472.1 hypothetical protein OA93_14580 [Flavobacterium sp. KMS]
MTKNFLYSVLFSCFFSVCTFAQGQSLSWINSHALPITDNENDNKAYYSQLTNLLKDNKICGLGEASHGTHEFYTEKNRIIKYLITNAQYKSIGFEFGYSAIEPINVYLLTGKGDLKQLMKPLRLFNTKEIYDLFEWVKTYNTSKTPKDKVNLFGFDTNYIKSDIDASANFCSAYLTKNASLYTNGSAAIPVLKKITTPDFPLYELSDDETGIISRLNTEVKLKGTSTIKGFNEFKKYISLLYQGTLLSNPLARDQFMAENLIDFQQETKTKTIIWGHNIHFAKDTNMPKAKGMGYHVKEKYGNEYYAIGFDTFKGKVTVLDGNDYVEHSFEAQPKSYSALFAEAKFPTFFVAFDTAEESPFYNANGNITNIYSNWTNVIALPMKPGIDFDALIFIRETTPSIILK